MMLEKRVGWANEKEKTEVLNYFGENGYAEAEKKFNISSGTIHNWERLFKEHGLEGLSYGGRGRKSNSLANKKDVNKD